MTENTRQRYDLYIETPATGLIKAAQAVLLESSGQLVQMAFLYTEEFREHKHAFALDPVQLPLTEKEISFKCAGGMPGVLDDYLPDDWGRKVLAKLAYYRDQHVINQHSAIDTLTQLSNSRIGALQWVIAGEAPNYEFGCDGWVTDDLPWYKEGVVSSSWSVIAVCLTPTGLHWLVHMEMKTETRVIIYS